MVLLALVTSVALKAQDVAVKTNLLYDATATVNAGIEIGLAPRWTFDLSGNYNGWTINERKMKHWLAQPELRYWFCDRIQGHFVGLHALGGQYNIGFIPNDLKMFGYDFSKLTGRRYQGSFIGAGVAYGYALPVSEHMNIEFELGAGYVYTIYDVFECGGCGKQLESDVPLHYAGITKAAVSLVYVF